MRCFHASRAWLSRRLGSSSRPRFCGNLALLSGTNSLHSLRARLLDVVFAHVAAVDQMLLHFLSRPLLDLLSHRLAQSGTVGPFVVTTTPTIARLAGSVANCTLIAG